MQSLLREKSHQSAAVPTDDPSIIKVPPPADPSLVPEKVAQGMEAITALLKTDIGAAWTLAGELAGAEGTLVTQAIIFGYSPIGLAVGAVAYTAYQGTTWLDNAMGGALHEGIVNAAVMLANMKPGSSEPYFGSDGFTTNSPHMMSEICSNWSDYWEDIPQIIAPIQNSHNAIL